MTKKGNNKSAIRTDKDKKVARKNRAIYSSTNPTTAYPNGMGLVSIPLRAGAALFNPDEMQYEVTDLVADAAWRKRLGLSYDDNLLIENKDGSYRLPKNVEMEIPTDTTFIKNRIAANEKLANQSNIMGEDWKLVDAMIDLDKKTLDALRKTYKTGEPVVINEYSNNSRKLAKDGELVEGAHDYKTPLNVLQNFTIQYDPVSNTMKYRDTYDFNGFESFVPGESFDIKGSIPLRKYGLGGPAPSELFKGVKLAPVKQVGGAASTLRNIGRNFTSSLQGIGSALGGAAIGALGQMAGKGASSLIGGGLSSGAGNAITGVTGTIGRVIGNVNPLLDGAVSLIGGAVGGLVNRTLGSKLNNEKISSVEGDINRALSFTSNAEDLNSLTSNFENLQGIQGFSKGDIGKDGWLSNKARNKFRELNRQAEEAEAWQQAALEENATNIVNTNQQLLEANYTAYGGPIDMKYTGVMSPFGNQFDEGGPKNSIPTQEEYIAQQIAAKKAAALDKSRNRTSVRVPMVLNQVSEEEWKRRIDEQIKINEERLSKLMAEYGNSTNFYDKLAIQERQNKLDGLLKEKDKGYPRLIIGANCMYNASDCYGLNIPGNKTFVANHKEKGFKKAPKGSMEPGDIVQDVSRGFPIHAMIYDSKDAEGNLLFNYAQGYTDSDAFDINKNYKKQAKYPLPIKDYDVYKYVGTPADSTQWINEYKEMYNKKADGGNLFTNGVTTIGNGGTHEENPYEGVQMGVDPQGIPNLVEEGEVIFNDYVFSNRLRVPKEVRQKYKLRGVTFADAAKQIQKESEERPNDPISKNGLEANMQILMNEQEMIRAKKNSNRYANGGRIANKFALGDDIDIIDNPYSVYTANPTDNFNYSDWFTVDKNNLGRVTSYSDPYKNFYFTADQARAYAANNPNDESLKSYLAKGNKLEDLTDEDVQKGSLDNMHGWLHKARAKAAASEKVINPSWLPSSSDIDNTIKGLFGEPILNINNIKAKDVPVVDKESPSSSKEIEPMKTHPLRYVPLGINFAAVANDLLGGNEPDYTNANMFARAIEGTNRPIGARQIGNYLKYTPFDRNYYINTLNANTAAARRVAVNTSGGNRAAALAGMLAADYNYGNQLGDLARQAEEYNLAQRQKVEEFNRATNMFNSEMGTKVDMFNAENNAKQASLYGNLAAMRQGIADRNRAEKSANLTNFIQGLGDLGREISDRDMLRWLADLGVLKYDGKGKYTGDKKSNEKAKGGRINRKKRGGFTI